MPTLVFLPKDGDEEFPSNEFKIGDRVRLKEVPPGVDPVHWTGTVARTPDPTRPLAKLGPHTLGNEVSVDTDTGNRAVADADKWEKI